MFKESLKISNIFKIVYDLIFVNVKINNKVIIVHACHSNCQGPGHPSMKQLTDCRNGDEPRLVSETYMPA